MYIHYYSILGCGYDMLNGRPILIAPPTYGPVQLQSAGFVPLPDGRWVHYLNEGEFQKVMKDYPQRDVTFSAAQTAGERISAGDNKTANYLSIIVIVLWVFSGVLSSLDKEAGSMAGGVVGLASIALLIFTRIKYPKNKFSKILMIILLILLFLGVVSVIAMMVFCSYAMKDCHID